MSSCPTKNAPNGSSALSVAGKPESRSMTIQFSFVFPATVPNARKGVVVNYAPDSIAL
jgi:hypothetical protein